MKYCQGYLLHLFLQVKTKQAAPPSNVKQNNEQPVEPSPRSVADLLGLGQEKSDEFLDIGASTPFGLSNDDDNAWVRFSTTVTLSVNVLYSLRAIGKHFYSRVGTIKGRYKK